MTVAETLEAMLTRTTDPAARAEIETALALLKTWDRKAGRYVPRGAASQRHAGAVIGPQGRESFCAAGHCGAGDKPATREKYQYGAPDYGSSQSWSGIRLPSRL